jgi:hypothetical protein
VVHVDELVRPCHLIPKMGPSVDPRWTSANVYEVASDFYLNAFIDVVSNTLNAQPDALLGGCDRKPKTD